MKFQKSIAILVASLSVCIAQAAPHGILRVNQAQQAKMKTMTSQQKELASILSMISPTAGAQKLNYYGGPVIANVKTYAVFWGTTFDKSFEKQLGDFFSATVNSSYFDWLKEYNTNVKAVDGRAGTNQSIGRGAHLGQLEITPSNTSVNLDDKDIQAELDHQIDIGALPKPDGDTLYMTYFPPGVSITIDGQGSCSSFCAYHEGFVSKKYGNVYYGVMPDQGGMCALGCGFASSPMDNLTVVSSHELTEAVTDPFPTPGDKPAYPQAWNDDKGEEIGDLCSQTQTQLKTQGYSFLLQQEFDNATAGCAPGPYQSP